MDFQYGEKPISQLETYFFRNVDAPFGTIWKGAGVGDT
jgi:hypothetical protein